MTLTTVLGVTVRATNTSTIGLSTVTDPMQLALALNLTSGTGSGKADELFHDERALGNGGSETLDLTKGGLTDAFGNAIAITKLKVLLIMNASADATLQIGGADNSQIELFADNSDILVLPSGSAIFVFAGGPAGLDITGLGDLRIKHGGEGAAGVNYKVIIVGATA